jgi:hypothetical protein
MPNGIYPDQKVVTGGELVVNALPEAMFIACSVCIQPLLFLPLLSLLFVLP